MARRNYKRELEGRNKRARDQGYKSYSEKRRALNYVNENPELWDEYLDEEPSANADIDTSEAIASYYRAFGLKRNAKDYSVGGAKAQFFVDVMELYTPDEWEALYPNGTRDR